VKEPASNFDLPPRYRDRHRWSTRTSRFLVMLIAATAGALVVWSLSECALRLAERYIPEDPAGGQHLDPSGKEVK